jgi:hypothetical protein|tara:strand:+ start:50 stop:448 length:399 start_codon:yes stop_codon:yes gene_type:complete
MAYSDKKQEGKIVKVNKADYRMGGTIGGLDLLGGGAIKGFVKGAKGFVGRARKALGKKAPKSMGADARAGITISKPNPGGVKGTGQSRTGKGKIHGVVTGGRSMKGMKSEKYSKLGSEGRRIQQQLKDIGLE